VQIKIFIVIKQTKHDSSQGFSLLELLIAMVITLVLMGVATTLFSAAIGIRSRQSSRTDALTSAQAALNVMSREISNSGYGLTNNGLVPADSNQQRLHFRSNVINTDATTSGVGEEITYFYDSNTQSILRFDPNDSPQTSIIVNRISNIKMVYFDYSGSDSTPIERTSPTSATGRVRITVTVILENVQGQTGNQTVSFTSDVTLRNSDYMLLQY
jgi:prepilin-type N-terminal cleavage/methylation domain-containing protein